MLYVTDSHPSTKPGTWCLCADGQVKKSFGAGLGARTRAYNELVEAEKDLWPALVAAAATDLTPWTSPAIAFVDTVTSDKRQLESGGGTFREFPQPLMLQVQTAWGHNGAVIAGRIDEASIQGDSVPARGVFDSGAMGVEAERLAMHEMVKGVSVDLGQIKVELEILEEDDDGWITDWIDHFVEWEVMGATQTPFPAFPDTRIVVNTTDDATAEAVQAAGPLKPDPSRFHVELDGPTPIDDDGEYLWGHIATWDTCHVGRPGTCITPPHSKRDYAFFTTGYVECDDGCRVPTGVLSMGGGHANDRASAREAIAHYDSTSTAVADVAIGEDEWGIWVAGAFRPNVTDEQLREFRAASPSGDWRNIEDNLELVAVLQVNVPGFPVPRQTVSASGVVQSLVAAVAPRKKTSRDAAELGSDRWMRHVDRQLRSLREQVIAGLSARVRP